MATSTARHSSNRQTVIPRRSKSSRPANGHSQADKQFARAKRLIETEVRFIHSAEFESSDAEQEIAESSDFSGKYRPGRRRAPTDVPSHLSHLWEVALLTPEEEKSLFRLLNYQRYCVSELKSRLDLEHPDEETMDRIEDKLANAEAVRNHIVQANLRLVVSIARKFVNDVTTLDELMSDGNLILMKAVNRFDYSRGFRFSTYATHAVQREFYRRYKNGQRRRGTEIATDPSVLFVSLAVSDDQQKINDFHAVTRLKKLIASALSPREQTILDMRFGLNADDGGMTLREVGERLKISKERVRQLQAQAIDQIRDLAAGETRDWKFSQSSP